MPKISFIKKDDTSIDSDSIQLNDNGSISQEVSHKGRGRGRGRGGISKNTSNMNGSMSGSMNGSMNGSNMSNEMNPITRISIVSQSISSSLPVTEMPTTTTKLHMQQIPINSSTQPKLSERLETQASRQKKTQMSNQETKEKTFSIVDRNNEIVDNPEQQPIRQNTCIVCLKINKSLFQQIFSSEKSSNPNVNEKNQYMVGPEESTGHKSVELQMELSNDKTLNVPEIYGLTPLDIQPERVNFKKYSDIDEECLNQKINSHSLSDKKIHLVLASFKNKTWPTSSPYVCWNCTEAFEGAPSGIPTIAMSDSYEDTYYLEGNFCSMNCAARYLFDTHQSADSQLFTIFEIMNFIYNSINGASEYQKIKLAPERICLKKFGGHLSIDDYRKNFFTNVNYELFKSPLIPALYHIAENIDLTRLIKNQSAKNNSNSLKKRLTQNKTS